MGQVEERCDPTATSTYEGGFHGWWMRLMIGDDPVKARKRMRYAGAAGFV